MLCREMVKGINKYQKAGIWERGEKVGAYQLKGAERRADQPCGPGGKLL
jgi:hypothetical protein